MISSTKEKTQIARFLSLTLLFFSVQLWAENAQEKNEIHVIDDSEKTINLSEHASRVISLAPHLTEMMFFLSQQDKLIARDTSSDYPEAAKAIVSIGNSANLNIEAILALKPDLILAWKSGNNQKQMQQLEKLGLRVFYSEPLHLEDIPGNLERLSILLGAYDINKAKIQRLKSTLSNYQNNKQSKSVKVFYQVWQSPLITLGGQHLLTEIINRCGGENIFQDQDILAPQISVEAVIERSPELIIYGKENKSAEQFWNQWTSITAVKNKRFLKINPDILVRPGPRIAQGLEQVCKAIKETRNI